MQRVHNKQDIQGVYRISKIALQDITRWGNSNKGPYGNIKLIISSLLAHGGHASSTVFSGRIEWLRKLAPRLEVQANEKAGHMMPVDAAEWTAGVVRDFLQRLD